MFWSRLETNRPISRAMMHWADADELYLSTSLDLVTILVRRFTTLAKFICQMIALLILAKYWRKREKFDLDAKILFTQQYLAFHQSDACVINNLENLRMREADID